MAASVGANSSIQLAGLDFNTIKGNFIQYLQGQDTFKDYNFQGSGLNVLLDVLAYNTQYNAFYLNMAANEMFLDTALQRSSVVSHAKVLDYTPASAIAPTAFIDMGVFNIQLQQSTMTLPAYTSFLSESVNGVNYNFVTLDDITVALSGNETYFYNIELKQGVPVTYTYTVDSVTNPKYVFTLPDANIDTNTIKVVVKKTAQDSAVEVYKPATNYLELANDSKVYFLQESLDGFYEIYFGDDILGKQLINGNVVIVTYIVTQGTESAGAGQFTLIDYIPGFETTLVWYNVPASLGSEKESIESIKYQAPKAYAAQRRAVTKEDYITLIQQNNLGYSFDAVNVWGGQENLPVVFGQVFICVKPTGALTLTEAQKRSLLANVIKPICVMTVTPNIVDPDYTFIKINGVVYYDPTYTTQSSGQVRSSSIEAILNYVDMSLNSFNSTFSASSLTSVLNASNSAITANEVSIKLQKKFIPNTDTATAYDFNFNTPLLRGVLKSGVSSSPDMAFASPLTSEWIYGIYIEEVPSFTGGVESIALINPGYGYTKTPTIEIVGDGVNATAQVFLNSKGNISNIDVLTKGEGYTSAIAKITPASGDVTGHLAAANVILEGRYGTLRTYYYNNNNAKVIFDDNVGTIDYQLGIITLTSFNPVDINTWSGELTISVTPSSTVIDSTYDKIITVDPYDSSAISIEVVAK